MIEATGLTKRFGDFTALDQVSCHIRQGSIYGMVGSNGAGKSTFLRCVAGVYRRDSGEIRIDGEDVWENPAVKRRMVFVPDELYFLPGADLQRMRQLYAAVWPDFDNVRYEKLLEAFGLPAQKAIERFSKGMKRQAATLLALCIKPDYYLFDETFDGLDPVMRKYVKGLICEDVAARNVTAIITSHSLRELEDVCDQLVLLHRGGVILEDDVTDLKTSLFRIQAAFPEPCSRADFAETGELLDYEKTGSVYRAILRGNPDDVRQRLSMRQPLFLDILPLTLEEVFTCQMQRLGYRFDEYEEILAEGGEAV